MSDNKRSDEGYFLSLIQTGQLTINDDATEVTIENTKKNLSRVYSNSNRDHYHYSICHKSRTIMLQRLVWIYHHKSVIQKGYQVIHKDGSLTNNRIENLDLKTLSEAMKYRNKHRPTGIVLKNSEDDRPYPSFSTKITVQQAEKYRCLYHQRKMTIDEIGSAINLKHRAVRNLLTFKSFPIDPITGQFDPELRDYYGDTRDYLVLDKISAKKNFKSPRVANKSKDHSDIPYMTQPLKFKDAHLLYECKYKKHMSLPKLSVETNVSETSIKRCLNTYLYFIKMYPNYLLMDKDERNFRYEYLRDKYNRKLMCNENLQMRTYTFNFVLKKLRIPYDDRFEIYDSYRNYNTPIEELADRYDISERHTRMIIIEMDRYRPYGTKGLSAKQFDTVYSSDHISLTEFMLEEGNIR